eukprot:COSAG02_NODE_245_length_27293_cov_16.488012_17_plen_229_part_00
MDPTDSGALRPSPYSAAPGRASSRDNQQANSKAVETQVQDERVRKAEQFRAVVEAEMERVKAQREEAFGPSGPDAPSQPMPSSKPSNDGSNAAVWPEDRTHQRNEITADTLPPEPPRVGLRHTVDDAESLLNLILLLIAFMLSFSVSMTTSFSHDDFLKADKMHAEYESSVRPQEIKEKMTCNGLTDIGSIIPSCFFSIRGAWANFFLFYRPFDRDWLLRIAELQQLS